MKKFLFVFIFLFIAVLSISTSYAYDPVGSPDDTNVTITNIDYLSSLDEWELEYVLDPSTTYNDVTIYVYAIYLDESIFTTRHENIVLDSEMSFYETIDASTYLFEQSYEIHVYNNETSSYLSRVAFIPRDVEDIQNQLTQDDLDDERYYGQLDVYQYGSASLGWDVTDSYDYQEGFEYNPQAEEEVLLTFTGSILGAVSAFFLTIGLNISVMGVSLIMLFSLLGIMAVGILVIKWLL